MNRHDYAFPFRIDASSQQAAQTSYERHVDQMIRQVLLTAPGERADLPEFGCGLRQLVFAPQSEALRTTMELRVRQSLGRWLGREIEVREVKVTSGAAGVAALDPGAFEVSISYTLIEVLEAKQTTVRIV